MPIKGLKDKIELSDTPNQTPDNIQVDASNNSNADYAEANGVHEEHNQDDNLDVHAANGGSGDGNGDGYEGDANVGMVIYIYQLEYECGILGCCKCKFGRKIMYSH